MRVGPLYGLARNLESVTPLIRDEDGSYELKRTRFKAELEALAYCGIGLKRVVSEFGLTAHARQVAEYHDSGGIVLRHAGVNLADPKLWQDLAEPGQLLIVHGFLEPNRQNLKHPDKALRFWPRHWDLADEAKHRGQDPLTAPGGVALPR